MNQRYLMSSAQKRVYTIEQVKENSTVYNVPMAFEIKIGIDDDQLDRAFYMLCQRHEVFRSHFIVEEEKFIQVVEEKVDAKLQRLSGNRNNLDDIMEEFVQPFDLSKAPLIRMGILHTEDDTSVLLIDVHHIVFDGSSMYALLSDLCDLYAGIALEPLAIQYKDFAAWQNSLNDESQKQYWLAEHAEVSEHAEVPADYPREKQQRSEGAYVERYLDKTTVRAVEDICMDTGMTPVMVYMTGLMGLLSRYSREGDVVIGTPVEGRNHPDAQDMIGMFVNTLAIRGTFEAEMTFRESLLYMKEKCLNAYENQDYLFEDLLDNISIWREANRNPLFDIMFSYEADGEIPFIVDGVRAEALPIKTGTAKFDLTLTVMEDKNGIRLNWEYNRMLYKESTISRLNEHYIGFLENGLRTPELVLRKIPCISAEEKNKIVNIFNTEPDKCRLPLPVRQFEKCVKKNPWKTAVMFGKNSLSYMELNEKANYIGKQLIKKGVGRNDVVAVIADRSIEMVCGIMGILKAGAAYLPIDPGYPRERMAYIVEDSGAVMILSNQHVHNDVAQDKEVMSIDLQRKCQENMDIVTDQEDTAYVIYTSGTTGKPKGVMIGQRSLASLIQWQTNEADIDDSSIVLQKSTYVFDASVWEIFLALLSGASLQLLSDEENNDFDRLLDIIEEKQVTHTLMIPTVFDAMLDHMEEKGRGKALASLCRIYLGAEAVTKDLLVKYCRVTGRGKDGLCNLYGPTESTVCATYCDLSEYDEKESVSIGTPIDNAVVYIMNDMELCGIGMPGEICIGGAGLAKGYVNNTALTEEKFQAVNEIPGKVLYRTGDMGKWREDGEIDYLGRMDDQIKIRGFRVETGEIEARLKEWKGVRNAAVILRKDQNKYLCAYITGEEQIDTDGLMRYVKTKLPGYMIPAFIIQLNVFPTTMNGKLDKKALPVPDKQSYRIYEEPIDIKEKLIANIFETVLAVEKVGRNDSFFEVGGDSIKAIRVVSMLREKGYEVSVRQIMESAVVVDIAAIIKPKAKWEIAQDEVTGMVERTPIQKYFYECEFKEPHHFNQSMVFESKEFLDFKILIKACDAIIKHHDLLRMVIRNEQQVVRSSDDSKFADYYYNDFRQVRQEELFDEINKKVNIAQRSIDLTDGPLTKVLCFQAAKATYVVIIIHHLVIDGVSWRILAEDLNMAYIQAVNGEEINLRAKTSSYLEWSRELRRYRNSEEIVGQKKYWQRINNKIETGCFLDSNKEAIGTSQISMKFSSEFTHALLYDTGNAYNTEVKDLLLTALFRTICHNYGNKSLTVNLEGHGREQISDKLFTDRTVGWFTALYPMILHTSGVSIEQDIREVKEQLRKIPGNGIGYGILATYDPVIEQKEADITFNYLGEFTRQKEADELFTISDISVEGDVSENNIYGSPITLSCAVVTGQMEVDIVFQEPKIDSQEAESILNRYKEELEDIISVCRNRKEQEPTASDFGEYSWSDEEFKNVMARISKEGGNIERIIPMTPMQEGMLYQGALNQGSSDYIVQCGCKIKGIFSDKIFRKSLDLLAKRYAALRTVIISEGVREPRQIVLEKRNIEYCDCELSGGRDAYEAALKADVKRGFHLEKDSLLRVSIMYLSDHDIRIVFCFHHIIIDGWCFSILMKELEETYRTLLKNEHLIESPVHEGWGAYETFARYIYKKDKGRALDYWSRVLDDYEEQSSIEALNEPEMGEEEIKAITSSLSLDESCTLDNLGRKIGVTNSTIIEAAWGMVLQLYNNKNDAVFAKIVSGRNHDIEGIEDEIGLFINAAPVRVKCEKEDTVEILLKRLQMQAIESADYDYVPLSEIQAGTPLGTELIHSVIAYENYQTDKADNKSIFTIKEYREQTGYKISVSAAYTDRLHLKLMYDTQAYSQMDAQLILDRMIQMLREIICNPSIPIESIKILDSEERQKVLYDYNNNVLVYNTQATVLDLFCKQAEQNPDNIAVSCGEINLSYKELDARADYLAGQLLKHADYQKGALAGLVCERSIEMVIGIYGVLKAGMAYIPISPELPEDRVQFMLEDGGVKILVHTEKQTDLAHILSNEDNCVRICGGYSGNRVQHVNIPTPADLAYMIYTSGTTGRPKGVAITHASLMNLTCWMEEYFKLNETSKMLQQFAFIFDGSIFEIFPPGIAGAELVIIPDDIKSDAERFLEYLPGKILLTVPSTFKMLLECAREQKKEAFITALAHVGLGGETLTNAVVRQYSEITGSTKNLHNLYGPTETTVCATAYAVQGREYGSIPIGKPIGNMHTYILQGERLCGIGMPGELCIGGIGVAAGYRNREELTAEKFADNPYVAGEKIYRTGDLVKWDFDGNIRYLGRIDEQVKIRGFRIELGEIQNRICDIEDVADAVVVTREVNNEQNLCAYLTVRKKTDIADIKEELRKHLPEYMIPPYFVILDQLPQTRNGKVDKRALPEPEAESKPYREPVTKAEKQVADAFAEILDIELISREDNFLELGGHSLKATRLVNRLTVDSGVKVPVSVIMKMQTVKKIALYIEETEKSTVLEMESADEIMNMGIAEEEVF